jgi:hypothetical protein
MITSGGDYPEILKFIGHQNAKSIKIEVQQYFQCKMIRKIRV